MTPERMMEMRWMVARLVGRTPTPVERLDALDAILELIVAGPCDEQEHDARALLVQDLCARLGD